jgi:N-acetylmuramoyl-L-alanine amidase
VKPVKGQTVKIEVYDQCIGYDSTEVEVMTRDAIYKPKPIKFIALHCTAGVATNKPTKKEDWIKFFYNVKYPGSYMVGYNYIVDINRVIELKPINKNATIEKNELVWGVAGYNSQTVSIAYTGGLIRVNGKLVNKDTRTPRQKFLIDSLVTEIKKIAPGVEVKGHRDFPKVNKTCPNYQVIK